MSKKTIVYLTVAALITLFSTFLLSSTASAASSSAFNAGRIIDDTVFTNRNSMSATDIQLFLNSKVTSCRAGYTCLKDYVENGKSAAQIIWEQSQAYSINPQVIIVTLQKENGLVTDTWPEAWQYRTAMGFACPDSGSCDPAYYGFTNQVGQGARHFRNYFDNNPNWFVPYSPGLATVKWSPNSNCGTSTFVIENKSTAALYSYTPYRPNQAALNNLYGSGDSCSAYGNRNFWRDFSDWFGSPTGGESDWRVVRTATDGKQFVITGNVKRWIPTSTIYDAWKLNRYNLEVISQQEMDAYILGNNLSRYGRNTNYYYYVDSGYKHYIPSAVLLNLWGYKGEDVVLGSYALSSLTELEPLGRFMKSSSTSDVNIYLRNGTDKHTLISMNDAAAWGYSNNTLTTVTPLLLSELNNGANLGTLITYNSSKFKVDNGQLIKFNDGTIQSIWGLNDNQFIQISPLAPEILPKTNAQPFIQQVNTPHVYMLDQGIKNHVANGANLSNWGYRSSTIVSQALMNSFGENSTDLPFIARDSSNGKVYILDGRKNWVQDSNILGVWQDPNKGLLDVSPATLSRLPDGITPSIITQSNNSIDVFVLDKGSKYHIPNGYVLNALGVNRNNPITKFNQSLIDLLPTSSVLMPSFVANNGKYYLLDDGYYHELNLNYYDNVQSVNLPQVSDSFLSKFDVSDKLKRFVSFSGKKYFIKNAMKVDITNYQDAFSADESNTTTLIANSISGDEKANYLVSNQQNSSENWLISNNSKYTLDFATLVGYGYISTGKNITQIPSSILSDYTSSGPAPVLIRQKNSWGVKLVNFGSSKGFPDSETLTAYGQSSVIADSIYNSLALNGNTSRLIIDDSGKIYFVENGMKRWISSSSIFASQYAGRYPIVYLYGTTMYLLPTGSEIK